MRRYRFTFARGNPPLDGEYRETIDGAIDRACRLSVKHSHSVLVLDSTDRNRARGIAEHGKYTWLRTCKSCGGDGCSKCANSGSVLDQ